MDVSCEFIYNNIQFQEVHQGGWHMTYTGHRKRILNERGEAIEQWQAISRHEFDRVHELYKRYGNGRWDDARR